MNKLSLETILKDTIWIAKMQGYRETGTYEEIGHLAESEDCRDFDISACQPEHLHEFYRAYEKYCKEHGWATIQEFYKNDYNVSMAEKIYKLLNANNIICGTYEDGVIVCVEIENGDWKHEHLRADWLVEENFHPILRAKEIFGEDDGSDCYSAIHKYVFA